MAKKYKNRCVIRVKVTLPDGRQGVLSVETSLPISDLGNVQEIARKALGAKLRMETNAEEAARLAASTSGEFGIDGKTAQVMEFDGEVTRRCLTSPKPATSLLAGEAVKALPAPEDVDKPKKKKDKPATTVPAVENGQPA
jgi:hypothetical protein